MYVNICMYVFAYVQVTSGIRKGQKRASDPMELELEVVLRWSCGHWEPNSHPLQGQQVLLTAKLSIQSFTFVLHMTKEKD